MPSPPGCLAGGAVGARAAQHHVVAGNGVPRAPLDLVEGPLELVVGECFDLAAVVAHEVMMVLPAGVNGLEARGAGADVDALDEAVLRKLFQCPIDTCRPDAAAFRPELVEDLLCRQATVLAPEQLDNRTARAAVAVAARTQ